MLSKRAKKGIIFGFLGGVVGFVIAFVLFLFYCALFFWGAPPLYPVRILVVGTVIAFFILILSIILKIKRLGILISIIIFLITYITTFKTSRMLELPINVEARETLIFWAMVLLTPLLIWIMFIIAGVKRGISLADKNDRRG